MPSRREDREDAQRIARQLGARLRVMRKKMHLTQDQVSERIGLTAEAFARIERGHSLPSFPTLMRICQVMNTRPDALLVTGIDGGDARDLEVQAEIAALSGDLRELDLQLVRDIGQLVRTMRQRVQVA